MRLAAVIAVALLAACAPTDHEPDVRELPSAASQPARKHSRVSFGDDFTTNPFPRWDPVTRSAWAWRSREGVFELTKNVPLTESVRAPFNRNLIKGVIVGDFRLDVDVQSTTRDYPHRSLCLFFGYQDSAHMYYVHFGRETGDASNQVFIVDGKDRVPISTKTTTGTPWDDAWHHARIVRTGGRIEAFFDDMTTPAMTADDTTFTSGQVGIGSFDDTGRFDNVSLVGQAAKRR